MRGFMQCMKGNGGIERMCKAETRAYMQCRMDRFDAVILLHTSCLKHSLGGSFLSLSLQRLDGKGVDVEPWSCRARVRQAVVVHSWLVIIYSHTKNYNRFIVLNEKKTQS